MTAMQLERTLVTVVEMTGNFETTRHAIVMNDDLERYLEMSVRMFCEMQDAGYDPSATIRDEDGGKTYLWHNIGHRAVRIVCEPQTLYVDYDEAKAICKELIG